MSHHAFEPLMVCNHVMVGTAQPEIHTPDDGDRVCTPCYDLMEHKCVEFGYNPGETDESNGPDSTKKFQDWLRTEGRQIFIVCKACYLKETGSRP